jgi:hypothetical protein
MIFPGIVIAANLREPGLRANGIPSPIPDKFGFRLEMRQAALYAPRPLPMNHVLLIGLLLPFHVATVEPSVALTARDLPIEVKLKGHFLVGKRWKDSEGESVVVLSSTSNIAHRNKEGERSAYLFGSQWRRAKGAWQEIWHMSDKVEQCGLDLICEFVPDSLELTDVDGNDIAEASFLYRLACKGGIDPDTQKLLLYEGARKYALRGTVKLVMSVNERESVTGGEFKADSSFELIVVSKRLFERRRTLTACYSGSMTASAQRA